MLIRLPTDAFLLEDWIPLHLAAPMISCEESELVAMTDAGTLDYGVHGNYRRIDLGDVRRLRAEKLAQS